MLKTLAFLRSHVDKPYVRDAHAAVDELVHILTDVVVVDVRLVALGLLTRDEALELALQLSLQTDGDGARVLGDGKL